MRTLILAALLGGSLLAQTPSPRLMAPAPVAPQTPKLPQIADPGALNQMAPQAFQQYTQPPQAKRFFFQSPSTAAGTPKRIPVQVTLAPERTLAPQAFQRYLQSPQTKRFFFQSPTIVAGTPKRIPEQVTLAPERPCAIPLINVAPKGGFTGDPKMAMPGSPQPANVDHMPAVQGAPPCADVKR